MSKDHKKSLPINYTNREFSGIRDDLLELAERFYPDNFQDFSEASFGAMVIDSVAYVGDQLSFHLDYNINESFLDTAYQLGNVLRQELNKHPGAHQHMEQQRFIYRYQLAQMVWDLIQTTYQF